MGTKNKTEIRRAHTEKTRNRSQYRAMQKIINSTEKYEPHTPYTPENISLHF